MRLLISLLLSFQLVQVHAADEEMPDASPLPITPQRQISQEENQPTPYENKAVSFIDIGAGAVALAGFITESTFVCVRFSINIFSHFDDNLCVRVDDSFSGDTWNHRLCVIPDGWPCAPQFQEKYSQQCLQEQLGNYGIIATSPLLLLPMAWFAGRLAYTNLSPMAWFARQWVYRAITKLSGNN